MGDKMSGLEFFSSRCITCKYYAGIASEKMCLKDIPCLPEHEIESIRNELKIAGEAEKCL